MLPLCIMNIEDDNDRRFVAELYIRYQSAMYRKAWGILKDDSYAEEARSREKPAPAFELAVPMYEGRLMLRVTDVKGRDYCGYVESSALS